MKYLVSVLVALMLGFSADAAQNGRPAMAKNIMSAPRYTASVNQISGSTAKIGVKTDVDTDETAHRACLHAHQAAEAAIERNCGQLRLYLL